MPVPFLDGPSGNGAHLRTSVSSSKIDPSIGLENASPKALVPIKKLVRFRDGFQKSHESAAGEVVVTVISLQSQRSISQKVRVEFDDEGSSITSELKIEPRATPWRDPN